MPIFSSFLMMECLRAETQLVEIQIMFTNAMHKLIHALNPLRTILAAVHNLSKCHSYVLAAFVLLSNIFVEPMSEP